MDFFPFDAEYLRRLRMHDAATEEHFADYFSIRLMQTLLKRGVSRHVADDVVQDTFVIVLNAVNKPDGIRQPTSFGAFVFGTMRNLVSQHRRLEVRNISLGDIDEERLEVEWDIEYELIKRENAFRAQQVLTELSKDDPKAGDLLRASFMDEKEKDQICAELGVTREYLRVLTFRARKQFLRLYLQKFDEQDKNKNHDDKDE